MSVGINVKLRAAEPKGGEAFCVTLNILYALFIQKYMQYERFFVTCESSQGKKINFKWFCSAAVCLANIHFYMIDS